ncbi:MAG: phage portal protein [Planctomyces sp.]|nr:phage portal protein [Planctomyces sp.]
MIKWLRRLAKRATRYGYDLAMWAAMGGSLSMSVSSSGFVVTRDTALKVAAYKRGVQLISDYIGKTPFHVKQGNQKAIIHPAWQLVRKWARWHELSAFEFRRVLTVHAITTGNGYGWIERDDSMRPVALWILDPRKISQKIVGRRTVYVIEGNTGYFEPHEIMHIKGMGVDGFGGLDPITTYAKDVLGLAIAQQNYATSYFASGGTPSTYVKTEDYLDDDRWAKMQSQSGPLKRAIENPHEIPVLEKAELKTLNLSAQQTQLLEAREFSLKDVANLLGLPVHKLQGTGNSSYKSLEEENRSFRDDSLDPWLVQFEMEYQKLLTEDEQLTESHDVEAVRESLTRTNMKDRAEILYKNVGGPIMLPNEGREILGLPPVAGGDELLKPVNMTPDSQNPTDPDPNVAVDSQRAAFDGYCVSALADVVARMQKRVHLQAQRTKPDEWDEFRTSLAEKHGDVVKSAFKPLVQLCGGDLSRLDGVPDVLFRACIGTVAIEVEPTTLATEILSLIRGKAQ